MAARSKRFAENTAFADAEVTYCSWKSKYGGMGASYIKRLKELEGENRRLKQMLPTSACTTKFLRILLKKRRILIALKWINEDQENAIILRE